MIVGFGVVGVVTVLAVLFAFQARLIFPGATSQGTAEAGVILAPGAELIAMTSAHGERIAGVYGPALNDDGTPHPEAASRPTILYFYGNGSHLAYAADGELDVLRRLGANVLIPEYLGYGLSGGAPSEGGCYETADAAYDELTTRRGVDPRRILIVGRSIGGAVAIDLASRREAGGLATFCTFTRMSTMVHRRYPFVPTSLLLRHKFESLRKIARVGCSILIGHGTEDQLVPSWMATSLASAAKTPVKTFFVHGAGHNDFYEIGGPQVFQELGAFVEKVARRADRDEVGAKKPGF